MTKSSLLKQIRLVSLLLLWAGAVHSQPTLLEVQLSTYLGGSGLDNAFRVAYDSFDDMWICGGLNGPGFPFPEGIDATPLPGGDDIFLVHIDVEEDNRGEDVQNSVETRGSPELVVYAAWAWAGGGGDSLPSWSSNFGKCR